MYVTNSVAGAPSRIPNNWVQGATKTDTQAQHDLTNISAGLGCTAQVGSMLSNRKVYPGLVMGWVRMVGQPRLSNGLSPVQSETPGGARWRFILASIIDRPRQTWFKLFALTQSNTTSQQWAIQRQPFRGTEVLRFLQPQFTDRQPELHTYRTTHSFSAQHKRINKSGIAHPIPYVFGSSPWITLSSQAASFALRQLFSSNNLHNTTSNITSAFRERLRAVFPSVRDRLSMTTLATKPSPRSGEPIRNQAAMPILNHRQSTGTNQQLLREQHEKLESTLRRLSTEWKPAPAPRLDMNEISHQVYDEIERRIVSERQRRGLTT